MYLHVKHSLSGKAAASFTVDRTIYLILKIHRRELGILPSLLNSLLFLRQNHWIRFSRLELSTMLMNGRIRPTQESCEFLERRVGDQT